MFQVKENEDHHSELRHSQKNNGQMCYKRDEYVQESRELKDKHLS